MKGRHNRLLLAFYCLSLCSQSLAGLDFEEADARECLDQLACNPLMTRKDIPKEFTGPSAVILPEGVKCDEDSKRAVGGESTKEVASFIDTILFNPENMALVQGMRVMVGLIRAPEERAYSGHLAPIQEKKDKEGEWEFKNPSDKKAFLELMNGLSSCNQVPQLRETMNAFYKQFPDIKEFIAQRVAGQKASTKSIEEGSKPRSGGPH